MNKFDFLNEGKTEKWRTNIVYILIAGVFLFYTYRLFSLQIINGEEYAARAYDNRTRDISIQTQRGIITDRNDYVLARNVASYNVIITPAYLPEDDGEIQSIYRYLSELIDVPVNSGEINDDTVRNFTPCFTDFGITQIVFIGDTNAPYSPVQIKCNIDEQTAMIIREKSVDLPGVGIEAEAVRDYPTGSLTAEIIGFLGPVPAIEKDYYESLGFISDRDKVGYSGIESELNDTLIGKNGERLVEVDGSGKELRDLEAPVEAIPGNNLKLTIDTRLQAVSEAALIYQMDVANSVLPETKYNNGVVIAMNVKTGEILSLVSYPSFENNRMARIIPAYYYNQLEQDPLKPLFNHAISAEHPPGSVFKMATAVGILNEGVVTPNTTVEDPGKISIVEKYSPNDPGKVLDYVCWIYKSTNGGHGTVDYLKGVAESCDVYFYKVGGGYQDEVPTGLGIWRIGEYAKALGYGAPTGIELPGEASGNIPDPNWKRINIGENWSTGDTYISTIGQGYVLATPIQVLVSIATLANDGKMMKPTLVREITDVNGNVIQPFEPTLVWDITKDAVINVYDENSYQTGEKITVQPWTIAKAKEAMRLVVTGGTAAGAFEEMNIQTAGKTGTAEYCDDIANEKGLCIPGSWPAHAWYVGYAPYDDPEIAVIAFVYNGDEGSIVAAPVVRRVLESYFELKAADAAQN